MFCLVANSKRDRCPALVLLLPVAEMWKDLTEKPRYYCSGSSTCLQACTHAHTHTCTRNTRAGTHTHTHAFASAQQRSHNLRENNVIQQFRLTLPEQLLKYSRASLRHLHPEEDAKTQLGQLCLCFPRRPSDLTVWGDSWITELVSW